MELTVMERVVGMAAIVQEGDIVFLRVRNDLIRKLGMSEEEIEMYQFKVDEMGTARWKLDVPQIKEVDLTDGEIGMIADSLTKLNREHKLTPNHVPLYEKFVEKK